MLAIASQQGQKIYTLTSANASLLTEISIDSASRQEIQNALNAGKEVTVHEQPINEFGWTGSGYVVIDPDTGAGGYKLNGGGNGGFLKNSLAHAKTLFWSGFGALEGKAPVFISAVKTVIDHISNLIEVIANCPTGIAIAAIISITLVIVGFSLLAPVYASLGTAALIGFNLFSGISITAVSAGWVKSCKK